ncbi:MAG: hypothetical protein WBV63_11605, partial [Candidatus Sulfotelmatobacter sp.]
LAVLPNSLGEEHPLGNHVFTQRCLPPTRKNLRLRMHINTMVCKGNMNFAWGEKKWRETTGVVPATMPGPF